MMNNELRIVGNIVDEPELRYTQAGVAVANFRVAWNGRPRDDGTKDTTYLRCSAWREMAENIAELGKGERVIVHGWLRQRQYETRDGEKRESLEVVVEDIGKSLRFRDKADRDTTPRRDDAWGGATREPASDQEPPF